MLFITLAHDSRSKHDTFWEALIVSPPTCRKHWEPLTEHRRRNDDELSLLVIELKLILTHPASHFSNATSQRINDSV